MERPFKRQRLTEPPEFDLLYRREQNDHRLKSTFEGIFEKYGKNFEGVGDEIDLETGEIVVNNGHVLGMINERDPGDQEEESEYESDEWSEGDGILASSLLLETGRRLGALEYAKSLEGPSYVDDGLPLESDTDSLMGDNDSLVGDAEAEANPPTTREISSPLDRLCDDSTEDELASSDVEWPTPREKRSPPGKAWPTPKPTKHLSQTPWHSSPIKRFYDDKPPVDPVWKAPPLHIGDQLRKAAHPMALPQRQKAIDIRRDVYTQGRSPQSQARCISAPSVSPHGPSRISGGQLHKSTVNADVRSKSTKGVDRRRWTMEEDRRLFHLRTTTDLTYSQILRYFPDRKLHAVMIHWSAMTRTKDVSVVYGSGAPKAAVTTSFPSPPKQHQSIDTVKRCESSPPTPSKGSPDLGPSVNGNDDGPPSMCARSRSPANSFSPKILKAPELRALQIHDNLESSRPQSIYSLYRYGTNIQTLPAEVYRSVSTPAAAIKEEQAERLSRTPASSLAAERSFAEILRSTHVSEAPRLSSPPSVHSDYQPESGGSVSSKHSYTAKGLSSASSPPYEASKAERRPSSTPRKPVFLPSCLSDDSEDELSIPVKTVGEQNNEA